MAGSRHRRQPCTPCSASEPNAPVSWTVMDLPGPAQPSENRTLRTLRTRRGPANVLPGNLCRYRRERTTASGAVSLHPGATMLTRYSNGVQQPGLTVTGPCATAGRRAVAERPHGCSASPRFRSWVGLGVALPVAEVAAVQVRGHGQEGNVDGGKVVSEPARQPDIGYRAVRGPDLLSELGERAAEPVCCKDEAPAGYDRPPGPRRDRCAWRHPRTAHMPCRLDRAPCQCVRGFDGG